MHNVLTKSIFPKVYKQLELRSSDKAIERHKDRRDSLQAVLTKVARQSVKVNLSSNKANASAPIVSDGKEFVSVQLPSEESIVTKKSYRQLAASILAIYEISLRNDDDDERRSTFRDALLSLLKQW